MSRLSRTDAAKSTIAVWRWLTERPDAPRVDGNVNDLFAALGSVGNVPNDNALSDRIRLMGHLGLVTREQYSEFVQDGPRSFPRHRTTTIIKMSVDEGSRKIARHFAEGGFLKLKAKGNQKDLPIKRDGSDTPADYDENVVAIRTNDAEEPVEAVVGEDAPTLGEALAQSQPAVVESLRELRKSEPAALVEAARQYNNRQDFVISKLTEIERLGVTIDREAVMRGINLARDDEFEGIVKVLPYIDELESRAKQAQAWRDEIVSLRNELRELGNAKRAAETELTRQKEANTRLATKMAQDTVRNASTVLVG